ncbi:MAG: P-type conjugative transfer protein TrbG [bacterium]|nr:P-type conjugative transfer protein TrbG [bacterium]
MLTSRTLALSLLLLSLPAVASTDPPVTAAATPHPFEALLWGSDEPESAPIDDGLQAEPLIDDELPLPDFAIPEDPDIFLPDPPRPKRGRQAVIDEAAELYRDFGAAPIIWQPSGVVFPFDESQPVVTCSPLRACDIELEPGEVIRDVALGDTERWVARPLMSGDVARTVPHVLVKPTAHGLETNLVVGTTRRTYHLQLVSPTEAEIQAGEAQDHRHVSFYYPGKLVESWTTEQELRRHQAGRTETAAVADLSGVSLTQLNFDYSLRPDRKVRWAPRTVFDDAEHVYIQLPASVRSGDLPALLVEVDGGGLAVSNYRVQGLWYVVDGLFRRAELVVGVGKERQKVAIVNERLRSVGE